MNVPPHQAGKRIFGRCLLKKIIVRTFSLACLIVMSTFWLKSYNQNHALFSFHDSSDANSIMAQPTEPSDGHGRILLVYYLEDVRAIAFSVLNFGAITVVLSARFSYLSSCHSHIFTGNRHTWTLIIAVTLLQLLLGYIPWLAYIFEMRSMDGRQWGVVITCMVVYFLAAEVEKAYCRHFKCRGSDADETLGNGIGGTEDIELALFLRASGRLGIV